MKKNHQVKKNSVWRSIDKEFKVTNVSEKKGKIWVFYKEMLAHGVEGKREYFCYSEAFLDRFIEFTNYRHSVLLY